MTTEGFRQTHRRRTAQRSCDSGLFPQQKTVKLHTLIGRDPAALRSDSLSILYVASSAWQPVSQNLGHAMCATVQNLEALSDIIAGWMPCQESLGGSDSQ